MAPSADAHKKSWKEMCDANCILKSLQRTSRGLCLGAITFKRKLCENPCKKVWFYSMRQKYKKRAFQWFIATYALVFVRQSL